MPSHIKSESRDIGTIDSNKVAERCPTAAWDMQQFWYNVTKAGEINYGGSPPAGGGVAGLPRRGGGSGNLVQIERNGNGAA